jgi:hypothetical protein
VGLERVPATDALSLLETDAATVFACAAGGRILHENDPDRSPAPRMYLAGCEGGNLLHLRSDIDQDVADEIAAVFAREPVLADARAVPRFLDRYRELLGITSTLEAKSFGQIHLLPHDTTYDHSAALVLQGTAKGDKLFAVLKRSGLPKAMVEMGHADVSHFWEPWCLAMEGDEIAAIAFAARLGDAGAALGLATMPDFRGRGFAAAVTAGWSSLPQLKNRTLIYSTTRDNLSSQRVIERLRLPYIGMSLRLI